ncbi:MULTISPECIES: PepSY-associated TM helix domain-containing protein [unclassified Streptomyces]|uniref:PepSY-associated TM helix domain-containing protein n=1 Tax=unclassified Streptomyces TaxID=2593676 RepID=UPI000A990B50
MLPPLWPADADARPDAATTPGTSPPERPRSPPVSPYQTNEPRSWKPRLVSRQALAVLTGLAYTVTPQLDHLVYGDQLRVEHVGDEPRPLAEQIAAARAAQPEGVLASVITQAQPEDTTRVVLTVPELGEKQRTVYVDPYTAGVQGELTTWFGSTPLTTWLDDLHRNLHLGEVGRLYSEVAASWLGIIVTVGLVLWLGRSRGRRKKSARGVLLPERGARGVRRTRSLHGATGVWISLGLLFLSATGLTWSHHVGERFGTLMDAVKGHAPALDPVLPGAQPEGEGGGEHAERAGHDVAEHGARTDPAPRSPRTAAGRTTHCWPSSASWACRGTWACCSALSPGPSGTDRSEPDRGDPLGIPDVVAAPPHSPRQCSAPRKGTRAERLATHPAAGARSGHTSHSPTGLGSSAAGHHAARLPRR